jgi:DinB family protein
MKKSVLFLLSLAVILFFAAPISAQEVSKADRAALLKNLEATRNGLEKAIKGLSPEQMNFKSAPERWSIAQCLEHIAAGEDFLYDIVTTKVMTSPAPAGPLDSAKWHDADAKVTQFVTDRSNKMKAPEPVVPNNRYGSPQGSWQHFVESRARSVAYAQKENGLRAHAMDGPAAKDMDAYQWMLYLSGHSARHTAQILEVKADPNFPKK